MVSKQDFNVVAKENLNFFFSSRNVVDFNPKNAFGFGTQPSLRPNNETPFDLHVKLSSDS